MGMSGLGTPPHFGAEQKAKVLEAALTSPKRLEVGYTCWAFEQIAVYVQKRLGIPMQKTCVFEIAHEAGLR